MKTVSPSAGNPCTLFLVLFPLLVLPLLSACGGGDGGGGTDSPARLAHFSPPGTPSNQGAYQSTDFHLEEVYFGRPLCDRGGAVDRLVNPASLVEIDPITGFILPGYPKVLFTGDDLNALAPFDLAGAPYAPKVVPRNGALLARFSRPVDEASLRLDSAGRLTAASPIIVRDRAGKTPVIAAQVEDNTVILNPVVDDRVGFPPSPVLFDETGLPAADPEGTMEIVFKSAGSGGSLLRDRAGWPLAARHDLLGSPAAPIGFNPGNAVLDFIAHDPPFNGFLPDLTPARIIREVSHEGTAGTGSGALLISDPAASFNVLANGGNGEWAGALCTVRPGTSTEESARVLTNRLTDLLLETALVTPPVPGQDGYVVRRAEYFEPIDDTDPQTAVDPVNHPRDPNDPEDARNSELSFFLLFDAWNGSGWDRVAYPYGVYPNNPIKPTWRIGLRFSEPMDIGSFRPYETFTIAEKSTGVTDPTFHTMSLGRIAGMNGQREIFFEPVLEDRFDVLGGDRFCGFGGTAKSLRCVIRGIPPGDRIDAFYASLGAPGTWPPEVIDDLEKEGVLGVTDLGGRSLGFPVQFFDVNSPHCILNAGSTGRGAFPPAVDTGITLDSRPEPGLPETGVVVHRFMGMPHTAADPSAVPPITGVVYNDHDDRDGAHDDNEIYGPRIAEFRLGISGFLSGHPVEFIEHVFDDYNPPGPSSPSAPDPIIRAPFGVGTPINAGNGVRFQHIYRRGDCSPDVQVYEGSPLDVVGLSWCPAGGNVTSTYIKEMAIALSLSGLGVNQGIGSPEPWEEPDTRQDGGIPKGKASGLQQKFDSYRGTWGPNGPYPAPDNYKEEQAPFYSKNVFDGDGDGSMRDEWQVVLGDSVDLGKLHASPVQTYADGRPYFIDGADLYRPGNQGPQSNEYLPYPPFDNPVANPGFSYDSTRGLLVEIRTDDNDGTPVALTNGYAFHIAIASSMLPRFRVYARGGPGAYRDKVYAATDPFDEVDPPMTPPPNPMPDDNRSWNRAWSTMLASPGNYGDNSRYFMVFDYAKRVSVIESPWIRVQPAPVTVPEYFPPVIDPNPEDCPDGTRVTFLFRGSLDAAGTTWVSDWYPPEEIGKINGTTRPYIQFRAVFESDLDEGITPFIDTVVIPFRK